MLVDHVLDRPAKTATEPPPELPGQVVLVFQGGGALGAYQGGVYQALHEAGIEPDWVVGTSIGGINAAIIAGNDGRERLPRLRAFWQRVESRPPWDDTPWAKLVGHAAAYWNTILGGIPGYFAPNGAVAFGLNALVGVEQAAFYTTEGLRKTVAELVDFERLKAKKAAADCRRGECAHR
jgi:NTE family protein